MQFASGDRERVHHIITASNVNKKLSFRGWEKCAEAFSQGKDNLSHRCAQLSQLDTSPLEETISWSSSDGECDGASSQVSHHRSNRTLMSQINFDDCKRVRRRGRRHSSALFVRCIEKRPKGCSKPDRNSPVPQPTSEIKQADANPRMPVISIQEREFPISGSESFDEPVWSKNLSLLNKRINLTSSCISSFNSFETLGDDFEVLSPEVKSAHENVVTSPILTSRNIRIKRGPTRNHSRTKREITSEENVSIPASESVLSSPIFKISIQRRRGNIHKAAKINTGGKNAVRTGKEVCVSSGITGGPSLPHKDSNEALETPMSPVIGSSTGKRRKPTRMLIEKPVSPILGSKTTYSRHSKILKLTSTNVSIGSSEKVLGHSPIALTEDKTVYESPTSNLSLYHEAKAAENNDETRLIPTPVKTTAKRTLDFSFQRKPERKDYNDCDISKSVATETETSPLQLQNDDDINSSPLCGIKMPVNESKDCDLSLNFSHLIEEVNSEPMDGPHKIIAKTPIHQLKKKKLSLSKKKSPWKVFQQNRIDRPLSVALPAFKDSAFQEILFHESSRTCNHELQAKVNPRENFLGVTKPPTSGKLPLNQTLFIEEESSEPMEVLPVDDFKTTARMHIDDLLKGGIGADKLKSGPALERGVSNQEDRKKRECDVTIDSSSSQSPENSQQLQIEGLPSSSVSSPIVISQTSSPPAAATTTGLVVEEQADDFNAPPRKGRKKLKSDGLAGRLQRLLNRQRSSSRIWQFKQSKQSKATPSSADSSGSSSSMVLTIDKTWTEYSHVIVQGCVSYDGHKEAATRSFGSLSKHAIVVLDPSVAEKLGRIMSASKIRIFPPWQALKLRGISLILCAYCIEVVISDSSLPKTNNCRAKNPEISASLKDGTGLSDIVFPKVVENLTRLFQCTEAFAEESNETPEGAMSLGTISALVSHHYVGEATSDSLVLSILRVFQFKPTDLVKSNDDFSSWSLLGQDISGEVCEIVLGCEQLQPSKGSFWQDVKSGEVIGKTYNFAGFLPIQRIAPFRVSNLWRVVSSMGMHGLCDQPVLYMLSAASVSWSCELSESERKKDIYQPCCSTLSSIVQEALLAEPKRSNIVCRLLHATKERLYVTDMGSSPSITVISVNPVAYLPPVIFKAAIVAIFDLDIVSVGDLRVDKYSRLLTNKDKNVSFIENILNEEQCNCLASLNPNLPMLQRNTQAKTLVMFFGTIDGVDEESAYMWPACGICDNELLSLGADSERYCCKKCGDHCENFILRMSLQVLCTCPNLPSTSSVRIKLLQSTIEALLPPALCGEEGYDMNAVLGQKLGPLRCEVLLANDSNFTLQQLPDMDAH